MGAQQNFFQSIDLRRATPMMTVPENCRRGPKIRWKLNNFSERTKYAASAQCERPNSHFQIISHILYLTDSTVQHAILFRPIASPLGKAPCSPFGRRAHHNKGKREGGQISEDKSNYREVQPRRERGRAGRGARYAVQIKGKAYSKG